MNPSSHRQRCLNAPLRVERLEDRRVLAGSGFDLPIAPAFATHGDGVSDIALQVVDQIHSHAAALLSPDGTAAQKIFPDVDGKDGVTPFDALLVVNDLNRYGARLLGAHETVGRSVDVDKDGWVTPFDALTVINTMNYQFRNLNFPPVVTQTSELEALQNFEYWHSQYVNPLFQTLDEATELVTKVYPVGDLVIPVHGLNGGFGGELADELVDELLDAFGDGFGAGFGGGFGGGGGMGGGQMDGEPIADFDALIDLISSTIAEGTWDELGDAETIRENLPDLSLIISQTQTVQEQIADLLSQLRRLQDLQVTIEVRFITLNDNFFEQIGVDFDFDIND